MIPHHLIKQKFFHPLTSTITRKRWFTTLHSPSPSASSSSSITHNTNTNTNTGTNTNTSSKYPSPSTNNPNSNRTYRFLGGALALTATSISAHYIYINSYYKNFTSSTADGKQSSTSTSNDGGMDTEKRYTLRLSSNELKRFNKENTILLYQYTTCPFCNKVQAFLDYHQLPYKVIEVNPLTKSEIKSWSPDYTKVPIAVINNRRYTESNHIIDYLNTLLNSYRTYPHEITTDEQQIRHYVDTELIPLITPNLYRTWDDSIKAFEYIHDNSSMSSFMKYTNIYVGALFMNRIAQKRLNSEKFQNKDVRQMLVDVCNNYAASSINKNTGFHYTKDKSPDIADLSMYGVLRATIAVSPSIRELLISESATTSGEFKQWYTRMSALAPQMAYAERISNPQSIDVKQFIIQPAT